MSLDGYFDDNLDAAILVQVDAIETAHVWSIAARLSAPLPEASTVPPAHEKIDTDNMDEFDRFELDKDRIKACGSAFTGKAAAPVAGPSKHVLQHMTSEVIGSNDSFDFGEITLE